MSYTRRQAPGELARLETFCNSARYLYAEDAFESPAAATTWLVEHEFVGASFELSEPGLRLIVQLRETIRAHLAGTDGAQSAATLTRLAEPLLAGPEWADTGQPHLRSRAGGPEQELLASVLGTVFTAGIRGELGRLKPCQAPECRWVFYDRSPRGNSIWCSMQICGARHKMRTYRTRS